MQKTKICCLNLEKDICDFLSQNFDVYSGSLGKLVDVTDIHKQIKSVNLLPNYDFPNNVHEYEIFITNLNNEETIKYCKEDHTRKKITGESAYYFISSTPETIFNPIPYGCWVLRQSLTNTTRPIINIIFQTNKQEIAYKIHNLKQPYYEESEYRANYSLTADFTKTHLFGKEIVICDNSIANTLFGKFINELKYYQTFNHPEIYDEKQEKYVLDNENFLPLLKNKYNDIVSYIWCSKREISIILPQFDSKKELLDILFKELLFRYYSEYFPDVETCSWKNTSLYYLPEQQSLLAEKNEIEKKYKKDILEIDSKIEKNKKKYSFLHDILSESGKPLVTAVIIFLKWLGFENVIDKDESVINDVFEEDIQVNLGTLGLLIIEVKGLHGTSKDSECSQISKVRFRRCEERNKFDVHALYIVNNERSIEPLKRTIPPFNSNQIKDAINDKRGLIYTWQLYNLFFNIENGYISKEEARCRILKNGLIDFSPHFIELGKPYKYYQERTIVCIELKNTKISNNDTLVYEERGQYHSVRIKEIQQNNIVVDNVSDGKIGIRVDKPIPNIGMLFLKRKNEEGRTLVSY